MALTVINALLMDLTLTMGFICDEGYFITTSGFAFLLAVVPTNTIDRTDISVAVRNIRLYA
jgi:hypothetical protein